MQYYITPKELAAAAPMGICRAREIIRKVREEMAKAGCILPPRGNAPRHWVEKRLGVVL